MINSSLENTLFGIPLLVGLVFVIMGYIMMKFPPKEINALYGYRTKLSMKSKEPWVFSQKHAARLMFFSGLGLMLFSLLGLLVPVEPGTDVSLSLVAIFVAIGIMIYKTENAIKVNFKDEE